MTAPTVDDLPIADSGAQLRVAAALEAQAAALARTAASTEALLSSGGVPSGNAKADRFERVLRACLYARTSTTVEGFLNFTRELCDGIDREFP